MIHYYAETKLTKSDINKSIIINPWCNWAGPHHSLCCRVAQQENMHAWNPTRFSPNDLIYVLINGLWSSTTSPSMEYHGGAPHHLIKFLSVSHSRHTVVQLNCTTRNLTHFAFVCHGMVTGIISTKNASVIYIANPYRELSSARNCPKRTRKHFSLGFNDLC